MEEGRLREAVEGRWKVKRESRQVSGTRRERQSTAALSSSSSSCMSAPISLLKIPVSSHIHPSLPCTMASPAYPDATKVKSPEHGKATNVVRVIQEANAILLNNTDVRYYMALGDQNADLAARNKILEADVESQERRITRFREQKDDALEKLSSTRAELEKTNKEKEDLAAKLAAAQEALREKEKRMASREAEFAKEVAALKRGLDYGRDALDKLRDFSVELKPVADNAKEIKTRLGRIFSAAKTLAETHFDVELPPKIMLDDALWSTIKGHAAVRLKKDIPLPLSNSTAAKQMRTAAFLGILTHEIRHHILQPTYLLGGEIDLNGCLNDLLEVDNFDREAYVRSVLLRVSQWFSEDIDTVMKNQINTVIKNVSACVPHLIPKKSSKEVNDAKHSDGDFESKLRDFCTQACEHWKYIQTLDGRIDLDFDANEARPLFPAVPESTSGSNTKLPRPNGSTSSPGPGKKSKDHQGEAPTLADAVVVWPAFYNRSTDDMETLVKGYVLTASQVAVAKGEEKAQQPTGPRRDQRRQSRASRSMSVSGGASGLEGSAINGAGGGGNYQNGSAVGSSGSGSSVSFLPQGSGGGRKGA